MKGPDHYLCAELRISEAHRASPDYATFLMAEAQVHATLALAAATAQDRLGLDDLTNGDVVRADLKTHAAMDATQALHNTGLNQTMLDRTGKRIRDIDLFGGGANRKQTLRVLGKHREHAKGVISLPRYVHFSPFKE